MKLLNALRFVLLFHLLALLLQATSAGSLLSGNGAALRLHEVGQRVIFFTCVLQIGLTVFLKIRGGCPAWLIAFAVGILLAEVIETYSGYRHILVLHVPLAVGIFGGVMRQMFWAFRVDSVRVPPGSGYVPLAGRP